MAASGSSTRRAGRELPQWLRFEPLRSKALFHSEQGWGSYLDLGIGDGNIRFTPLVAIDNADDLVEEYSGYGLRFETRKLGTRRLGASLEWSRFDQDWRAKRWTRSRPRPRFHGPTRRDRRSRPLLKFAFSADLSIAAGVSISELEPLFPATGSRMANAAVASIGYDRRWKEGDDRVAPRRRQLRRARRLPRSRKRSLLQEVSGAGLVSIRLRTPSRDGGRNGWRDHRPGAALRALHARRLDHAAGLGQVRHRAGRRRSDVLLVDRVSLHRPLALPRRRFGLGRGHRAQGPRSRPGSGSTRGRHSWSLASR